MTFLDLASTKTSEAFFCLRHCNVHCFPAAVPAFLTPQALSLVYPVQVIVFSSAANVVPAIVSTIASNPTRLIAFRMFFLPLKCFPTSAANCTPRTVLNGFLKIFSRRKDNGRSFQAPMLVTDLRGNRMGQN